MIPRKHVSNPRQGFPSPASLVALESSLWGQLTKREKSYSNDVACNAQRPQNVTCNAKEISMAHVNS